MFCVQQFRALLNLAVTEYQKKQQSFNRQKQLIEEHKNGWASLFSDLTELSQIYHKFFSVLWRND